MLDSVQRRKVAQYVQVVRSPIGFPMRFSTRMRAGMFVYRSLLVSYCAFDIGRVSP
jgi:hypothetical protein